MLQKAFKMLEEKGFQIQQYFINHLWPTEEVLKSRPVGFVNSLQSSNFFSDYS